MDDGGGSGLDAAVITVDRFVPADLRVLETIGLLLGDEQFDILAQRALVAPGLRRGRLFSAST